MTSSALSATACFWPLGFWRMKNLLLEYLRFEKCTADIFTREITFGQNTAASRTQFFPPFNLGVENRNHFIYIAKVKAKCSLLLSHGSVVWLIGRRDMERT